MEERKHVLAGMYISAAIQNMNKRTLGAQYRTDTLLLLAKIGYGSTRQIARGVWGRCDKSSRRMASRTLRWLLDRRYLVSKREGDGVNLVNHEALFALSHKGAIEALRWGVSMVADKVHARDYLRHAHDHRTVCNSVFVAWPNGEIWSELSVRTEEAPVNSYKYQSESKALRKIPDLIAISDGRYEWVEVENSWRSEKDLSKVVECIRAMFADGRHHIGRMHFVVTDPAARTIGQRISKRLTHGPDSGWSRQTKELDARVLQRHLRFSELNEATLELRELPF